MLLHEHIHWSGHEVQLKRGLIWHYGSRPYVMEGLVAELGAAFLCAPLGISAHPRPDQAAYIAIWSKVLRRKQLKSAICVATTSAAIACRFLGDEYLKDNRK